MKLTYPPTPSGKRGNKRHSQQERLWAKKLPLRGRLALNRAHRARREFLPIRPIWRLGARNLEQE
jgi:hypothetical protein